MKELTVSCSKIAYLDDGCDLTYEIVASIGTEPKYIIECTARDIYLYIHEKYIITKYIWIS